jgi:hypothetical protein
MAFPEDETLKALLDLPLLCAASRAAVERYFESPAKWQRDYYADEPPDGLQERREWELTHGTAKGLCDELCNAVQAHWHELLEKGLI